MGAAKRLPGSKVLTGLMLLALAAGMMLLAAPVRTAWGDDEVASVTTSDGTVTTYTTIKDAFDAAEDGSTITLLADTSHKGNSTNGYLSVQNKSVVLDLNGYTLELTAGCLYLGASNTGTGTPTSATTLTIKDSSEDGSGVLTNSGTSTYGTIYITNSIYGSNSSDNTTDIVSTLNIEGGTVSNTNTPSNGTSSRYVIYSSYAPNINITGGTVTATGTSSSTYAIYVTCTNKCNDAKGTLTIANATVSAPNETGGNAAIKVWGMNVKIGTDNGSTDATYVESLCMACYSNDANSIDETYFYPRATFGTVTLNSGTVGELTGVDSYTSNPVTWSVSTDTVTIGQGSIKVGTDITEAYNPLSRTITTLDEDEDGTTDWWLVGSEDADEETTVYVAQVNGTNYAALADALDAAASGGTVTLLTSFTQASSLTVEEGASTTLDLAGNTLTFADGATFTNNGTLTLADSSSAGAGALEAAGTAATIANAGTLSIAGGTYSASSSATEALISSTGTATVSGGTFKSALVSSGTLAVTAGTFAVSSSSVVALSITGGTATVCGVTLSGGFAVSGGSLSISSGTYSGGYTVSGGTLAVSGGSFDTAIENAYCAEGYAPTGADDDGWYSVALAEAALVVEGSDGTQTKTLYAAVEDAIAAAASGATVQLQSDATLESGTSITAAITVDSSQSLTLDLNGCTLAVEGEPVYTDSTLETVSYYVYSYAIENNGTLTIADSSEAGTGAITGCGVLNNEGATLTVTGGTISCEDSQDGNVITNAGTLSITGGTFEVLYEGSTSDSSGRSCVYTSGTATITGGTFTSVSARTYAITCVGGSLTIAGPAEVSGSHGAVGVSGGAVIIADGTFTGTGYYALYVSNDGATTSSSYVVVEVGSNSDSDSESSDSSITYTLDVEDGSVTSGTVTATPYVESTGSGSSSGSGSTSGGELSTTTTTITATVAVLGGTFAGAGQVSGSATSVYLGSDVNSSVDSSVAITSGYFQDALYVASSVSSSGITAYGGLFENSPEAVAASGYSVATVAWDSGTGSDYTIYAYTVTPLAAGTLGGSLRIATDEDGEYVTSQADLRLGFYWDGLTLAASEDELGEDDDGSLEGFGWTYGTSGESLSYTLEGANYRAADASTYVYDGEATGTVANLVLTGTPLAYFGSSVYARMYVTYRPAGASYTATVWSEVMQKSVMDVVSGVLSDTSLDKSGSAYQYASALNSAYSSASSSS